MSAPRELLAVAVGALVVCVEPCVDQQHGSVVGQVPDAAPDSLVVRAEPLLPIPGAARQHQGVGGHRPLLQQPLVALLRVVVELLLQLDFRVLETREWYPDHEYRPGLFALEVQTLADLATTHRQQQRPLPWHSAVVLLDRLREAIRAASLHHHPADNTPFLSQRFLCLSRACLGKWIVLCTNDSMKALFPHCLTLQS